MNPPFRSPHPVLRDRLVGVAVAGLAVVIGFVYALVDLPLSAHLLLSAAFVAIGYWIATRAPSYRLALAYLSAVVSLRYIFWRGNYTLGLMSTADLALAWALFAAEVYGIGVLLAGYFQTAVLRPRRPVPLPEDDAGLPWVDIFIPTYDESPELVRRTLIGAMAIRYPHKTVHLLDDGRRPAMRALAESLGVSYRTRVGNAHAKAGNINAALAQTTGELVAIFDCDHVPVRSFLDLTVGFFVADPGMALVQTPHHFYNADPFERNLWLEGVVPPEQHVFYHAVQIGNDFWNSVLFCGSCAVIRRTALEQVGGIAQETVTEDAHTSMRLAAAGWRSAYLDIPLAAGLATERYAFHVAQRIRWARGMTQILRLDNPLFKKGLSFAQRVNYLNAIQHFQFGIPRLIFLLAPPAYLVLGLHPLAANPWEVMSYAVPHVFLSVAGGMATSRSMRHAFWAEVYETALAPFGAVVTALALIAPRRGKFNVTVKGARLDRARFDLRRAFPNLVLLALTLAGLALAPGRLAASPFEAVTLAIASAFAVFNSLVLLAAVTVALETPQQRAQHRVTRTRAIYLVDAANQAVEGHTADLSEEGLRLILPAGTVLPDAPAVSIWGPDGWSRHLPFAIQSDVTAEGERRIGARLTETTEADRQLLVEMMFSEPDSWVVTGRAVNPLRSLLQLSATPWRAARATLRRSLAGPR